MDKRSGIYEILNTVNGHRYIGSTKNFHARWKLHQAELNAQTHHSRYLQNAWNLYGAEAFKFLPILECARTREMLLFYEQQLIDKTGADYNVMRIADSHLGVKRSDETRRRLSAAMTGKAVSTATRKKLREANMGKTASAETRAKMSATQSTIVRGPHTAETKAKLSALYIGTTRTAEDCAKISAGMLGKKRKPHTAETKAALSAALKGRPVPPAVLAARIGRKQSAAHIASRCRPHSAETRAKMSASHLAYRAAQRNQLRQDAGQVSS